MDHRLRTMRGLVLAIFAFLGPLLATAADRETASAQAQPRFVALSVSAPGAQPMTLVVKEGSLATYAHRPLGLAVGLVPVVTDLEGGDVDLRLLEVRLEDGEPPEVLAEVDLLTMKQGFPTYPAVRGVALTIQIDQIAETSNDIGSTNGKCLTNPTSPNLLGPCCVGCGGTEGCGCRVNAGCGSCCTCAC